MLFWKIKKCLYIIWFDRIFILCGYPEEFFIIPVILCFTVVSYKL